VTVTPATLDRETTDLLRELAPRVLSAVVRRYRDFAAGEDAVQEALLAAACQWPQAGVPANPAGWLVQVASRRMTDQIRREIARRRREAVTTEGAVEVMSPSADDRGHPGPDATTR
jgi:predicted RNA polymerase sigma factor